jgi:hypothetical protein
MADKRNLEDMNGRYSVETKCILSAGVHRLGRQAGRQEVDLLSPLNSQNFLLANRQFLPDMGGVLMIVRPSLRACEGVSGRLRALLSLSPPTIGATVSDLVRCQRIKSRVACGEGQAPMDCAASLPRTAAPACLPAIAAYLSS